ncbi:NAD-dependent epimerase/dehydratase family protein [Verrucomicrobiota bacterium sgz303538]
MRILITGICGFVGSVLARELLGRNDGLTITGIDNLSRPGSERNRRALHDIGVVVYHGDIRQASDVDGLPAVDWVIDAAANPSVLAGVDGRASSRQLVEHNLHGTINLLEYCRRHGAGFVLLSTSRVYSIPPLSALPVKILNHAFTLDEAAPLPLGISSLGVREEFSITPPVSLYGATKLASEFLALEYGEAYTLPVWINRCGVLAGAGQFGRADQGIFSFWIHSWAEQRPLRYIGFDGQGHQVRDCLHPRDLVPLLSEQMKAGHRKGIPQVVNVSGGAESAMSLQQLSQWCEARFGPRNVDSHPAPRPYDLPWVVLDSHRAYEHWNWRPEIHVNDVLEGIAAHARAHPHWISETTL